MPTNQQIRDFSVRMNLSKAELARILGVSHAGAAKIIALKSNPSCSVLENLVTHYPNVNARWFLTGEGNIWDGEGLDGFQPPGEPYSSKPTIREYQIKLEAITDQLGQLRDQLHDKERIIALYESGGSRN